jgi:ribose 5-phosphate isomerase B
MIALGSDHAGYELKNTIIKWLESLKLEYMDWGTDSTDSCDYPKYAFLVANHIKSGQAERGILVCGTGIGISIAANRYPGVRCALCGDKLSAELSRRHNDANVLALGARIISGVTAVEIVKTWLDTPFEGGRHSARIAMIDEVT